MVRREPARGAGVNREPKPGRMIGVVADPASRWICAQWAAVAGSSASPSVSSCISATSSMRLSQWEMLSVR